jgi:hypothetical protein
VDCLAVEVSQELCLDLGEGTEGWERIVADWSWCVVGLEEFRGERNRTVASFSLGPISYHELPHPRLHSTLWTTE